MPKIKVTFHPQAFDGLDDMTQDELDDLVAEIERMVEDGSLFDNAEELTDEDIEELGLDEIFKDIDNDKPRH